MPWVLIFKKYTRDQRLIHWLLRKGIMVNPLTKEIITSVTFLKIYNGNTTDQMWDRKAQPILTDEL